MGQRSQYSDWLQDGRPRGRSSSPGRVKNSLLHVIQTGSGAHPASYPMGTGGKADHSPLTSADVKKVALYIHSPIRLHGVVLNSDNIGVGRAQSV
jgi:hypothetical protein